MLLDGQPFTRRTAHTLTGRRAYRLVADGAAREVLRGVYVDAAADDTVRLRAPAASLVLPDGAALCRGTVAWLEGFGDVRLPGRQSSPPLVECVLPAGRTPVRRPGLHCYAAPLPSDDLVETDGLIRTSDLRTALDLARWLPRPMALAVLDAMAHSGRLDLRHARVEIERFARHRGTAQARQLLGWVEPATESYGESWLRLRVLDAGFPRPTAQVSIKGGDGRERYRLDLGFEELRRGIEYDGEEFHSSSAHQRADERRRHELRTRFGWDVVGFHRGHVWGSSMALERAVGELIGEEPQLSRRRW